MARKGSNYLLMYSQVILGPNSSNSGQVTRLLLELVLYEESPKFAFPKVGPSIANRKELDS